MPGLALGKQTSSLVYFGFIQLITSRGGLLQFIAQITIPLPGLGETQSLALGKTYQTLALAS